MAEKNLYYLDELDDYKVKSGYPDVRGWKVMDKDRRNVGKVENLLVSKKAEKVVYLDVEVDESLIEDGHEPLEKPAGEGIHEFINKDGENHLIIPIGLASIDEDNKEVICKNIGHDTFRKTKRFKKGSNVDPGYELIVYRHYLPDNSEGEITTLDDDFYNRRGFRNNI